MIKEEVLYEDDRKLLASMPEALRGRFVLWIAQLDQVLADWGKRHCEGDHPYGGHIARSTGLECWHQMWVDGMTPERAFAEDRLHWD